MFLVTNIDQMYKEMKKIVEVRNNQPTDPNFEDHVIGNTHYFFWPNAMFIDL
jgi:hypothetical protein